MSSKRYLALARVSSREQEREGFSLEVQEEALIRYATQHAGNIVRFFKIAETASKKDERKVFKELMAYAKSHAHELDGVLFFKVDRAARNIFDYVELERLEADHELPVIYVSQPTENTPAGRMMRRTLANMAAFFTEQQSLDVRDGLARRVQSGWFVGKARYGYLNVRRDGRGLVEAHPDNGPKVTRIFQLYATRQHTLDSLRQLLLNEGVNYTETRRPFPRSVLHAILRDRSYLGEVQLQGQWYPGKQPPLVDHGTFTRVQGLLRSCVYQSHELTFASELITCGHCGRPITGEVKTKSTRAGVRHYTYYHCTKYTSKGHPRVRVTEGELDRQVLRLFDQIRIESDEVRRWFQQVLQAQTRTWQQLNEAEQADIQRQLTSLRNQQDRLLNLRLLEEIDVKTFAAKNNELRDRIAELTFRSESTEQNRAERSRVAEKAFELSQNLSHRWVSADYRAKRQLLQIVCLNLRLDGVTLVPEIRKPFDVLVKGLSYAQSRGGRIRTDDFLHPKQAL